MGGDIQPEKSRGPGEHFLNRTLKNVGKHRGEDEGYPT